MLNKKTFFKEVGDLPPEPPSAVVSVNIPQRPNASTAGGAAQVRDTGNFQNFYDERRAAETVVACLIGEAGGEGRQGMEAVLEVIRNRALKKYGNDSVVSMYKIVVAPKQFSYFNGGIDAGINKAKRHPKWREAENVLKSGPTNHTKGSTYYYAASLNRLPLWVLTLNKMKVPKVQIGNHIFFYNVPKRF